MDARDILDEGLDELAAHSHRGLPARLFTTFALTAMASAVIDWRVCALWCGYISAWTAWGFVFTRRQAQGLPVSWRIRLGHVAALAGVTWGWLGMGLMLWTSGRAEGAVMAVVIWLSIVFFTQTQGYQSRLGLLVGGVIPAMFMLGAVLFAPHHPDLRPALMGPMVLLALLFAVDGVVRMAKGWRRLLQAQAQLGESEHKYRVLADNLMDVIALSDFHGRREYISPSVEHALGYTPEELMGTPNFTLIHPEDAPAVRARVDRLGQTGGEVTLQYRCFRKDGEVIWAETLFSAVPGPDGRPEKLISTSRDISKRREMERLMTEALERAEQGAAAKSDFLANMTHELRTPLNAIVGFSGLLRQSDRLDGEDARHVRLISDASATLLELVNGVLDFSRLEAGAVEPDPRVFDPLEEAEAAASLLRELAETKGLTLTVRAEGPRDSLVGDAPRIRQVMLNFLSNAVKFTTAGEVTLTVRQSRSGDPRKLMVSVRDTGIGVPAEQLPHVFERFTQADLSVSRRFGGTGLGLAICRKIVEMLGGRIGADSREGDGSTFWFELDLPVARAAARKSEAASDAAALERPIRLLLVEDVAVNRELVAALLRPFDVEIITACDGVQAIEAMDGGAFDLVLMDVQMPVMDGLTAARRIRAMAGDGPRTTPIIAMTANVLPDQVQKCLEAGMDDHMGKPIMPARLLEVLAEWSVRRREADNAGAEAVA